MKIGWKTCFKIGLSIFLLYLCIYYWPSAQNLFIALLGAASPLIIGCAIAYIVNVLMSVYEKIYFPKSTKKFFAATRRPLCMLFAFVSIAGIIVLIISLIIPQLVDCVMVIYDAIPKDIQIIINFLERFDIVPDDILDSLAAVDWQSKLNEILGIVTSGIGNIVSLVISVLSSVFGWLVTMLIAIIFSVYLLCSKEKLGKQLTRIGNRYLKEKRMKKVLRFLSVANVSFKKYIIGQSTEALILGILCILGMLLFKLPYATMIGALIGFTALIPIAGAYIGAIVGAFMILTVSPMKALFFIIFIIILQQLEGNIIYPRVVGSALGLPGIWVLAAVTVGGGLFGVLGMLIGVPIASTVYRLLKEDVNNTQKSAAPQKEKAPDEAQS